MPKALIPVAASNVSVARRVAVNMVKHITELMGLPETTTVFLPGQTQAVPLNDGEFGNCCSRSHIYPGDTRIIMTVIEEAEEEHTFTNSIMDKQHRPIMVDRDHNVEVYPVYQYMKMTCNIEFVAPSSTIAQRWLDDQRAMYSAGRTENMSDLEYYYQVPEGMVMVLKGLHDAMMKSPWPLTSTFEEWVVGLMVNNAYLKDLTTLNGSHHTMAIAEHQYDVLGWFDWTTTPDTPERNSDGSGTFTVNLNYQLRYNRPTHVFMDYPMLMRQYPVSKKFRHTEPYWFYRDRLRKVSRLKEAFDEFRFIEDNLGAVPYVHYPNTDDWFPELAQGQGETITLFTGLVRLSADDQQSLMDLSRLGTTKFTPHFLEYFYAQGNSIFIENESMFEFRLWRNKTWLQGAKLKFKPGTLQVQHETPLDPKYVYHIQICIKRNWARVLPRVASCLRNWPTVAWYLFRSVGVLLGGAKSPAELKLLASNTPRRNEAPCRGEGYLLPEQQPGGINWGVKPEDVFIKNGYVMNQDIQDAIKSTDVIAEHLINNTSIGPLTVMFANVLTFRK